MAKLELTSTELGILRDALELLVCTMPANRYEHYVDDDGTPVTEQFFDALETKLETAAD